MSKGLEQRFLQRRYTNDQHEKCSNIFNHYRNTNHNHSEKPTQLKEDQPPLTKTGESPHEATKTWCGQKHKCKK